MKFEFDTRTDTAKDAAALAAALAVLHGDEVAKVLDAAATRIEVSHGGNTIRADEKGVTVETGNLVSDEKAADGYSDTSAADAFGATASNGPVEAATVDTAGIPWDERIHASTKTTNKDGTWTRRRNTDDALFDKVMAELKGTNVQTSHIPEVAEASVVPPPPAPSMTETTGSTADAANTAETVVPPPPPSTDPITFPKLMVKITKAQTAKTIDPAKVLEFLGMFGLSAVKELASAPAETIQAVNDLVDAHVGA